MMSRKPFEVDKILNTDLGSTVISNRKYINFDICTHDSFASFFQGVSGVRTQVSGTGATRFHERHIIPAVSTSPFQEAGGISCPITSPIPSFSLSYQIRLQSPSH